MDREGEKGGPLVCFEVEQESQLDPFLDSSSGVGDVCVEVDEGTEEAGGVEGGAVEGEVDAPFG